MIGTSYDYAKQIVNDKSV